MATNAVTDRPRALRDLDALEPLLEQLHAPDTLQRASTGGGAHSGGPVRTPTRVDILDARAHADRTLALLRAELQAILGVGADTMRVPAWLARCWTCGQGTLRYHIAQEIITCAVCLTDDGEPYRWPASWLRDPAGEDGAEGEPLTLVQRLKQRIAELEAEVDHWRVRYYDLKDLAELTQPAGQGQQAATEGPR